MERRTDRFWAIAVCVAIAALLRFVALASESLWIDEIYSVEMTRWPLDTILHVQDGHPPLFALLHVLVAQWVDADFAGRLIAATAGVLAVALLVELATELWDVRTGFVAGLLLATSPLHVWYSREGRSYALVVLIAIAASLALVRAVRGAGRSAWLVFALCSVCGIFTHYLYAGLILAQVIFLAAAGGQGRLLATIAAVAAIGAACVPMFGPEATSFVGDQRGFEWLALPYAGFTYVVGFGLGPSVAALHQQRGLTALAGAWPEIIVVGVLALGVVVALPAALRRAGRFGSYILLWAIVPIMVVFAGSWVRNGAFNVRYTLPALPGVVLCVALVLTAGSRRRLWAGLALLLALSAASIARDRLDETRVREDVRSAAHYLAAHAAPTDRVVVSARYMDFGVGHYYRGGATLEGLPVRPIRSPEDAARNLSDLRAARPTWLVLVRAWEDDPAGYLDAALGSVEGAVSDGAAASARPIATFPGVRIFRLGAPAS